MSRSISTAGRRTALRMAAVATGFAVAVLPLAATGASADTTPAPTPTVKGCATGTLPAAIVGKPVGFKGGLPAGVWAWHDSKGWHVRVTHDSKKKLVFSGTVHSSRHITGHRVKLEHSDRLHYTNHHTTMAFRFRNYGAVDGFDFHVGCAKTVTFTLKVAGANMSTTQIHLGATGANPTSDPFVVQRS